ncbi:hypothetical protein PVL30_004888 [Lodderomyces elongisporus]|uniref:uncharacterized protein n=1 Tax=Lodderomyces elongisporus TaxID=36914 RepID=UPI0029234ECA|nr:uncharacterized protein PVL30_004888 [Lodderomyces elongisporus]WLF81092.1 hypothetical protein PVL30_004888 [Lodderomyces elongisporus]
MSKQYLTPEQINTFQEEGMLCIPNFLSHDQTQALLKRSKDLLQQCDLSTHPKTTFKTSDDDHIGDTYFYESADRISYFFDTDAFNTQGELTKPLDKAINKIGHGLHIHDQIFNEVTFDTNVKQIATDLEYKEPKVLQSMCIFKQPVVDENASLDKTDERDNAVPPHTDATFLYTKPTQTAMGYWFALEDCTEENGCLKYLPGTHKKYPVTKRFVRSKGLEGGCQFEQVANDVPIEETEKDYVTVPCKAGSLILINHSVLHKSEKNRSRNSRYAYAFHIIEGTAEYDEKNWLQVPYSGGSDFSRLL